MRRPLILALPILACLAVLTACGRTAPTWQEPASGTPATTSRAIVIAPPATGSLTGIWSEAGMELAQILAKNIEHRDLGDVSGYVADTLPAADDPAWRASGPRTQAPGAHLVVLAQLAGFTTLPVPASTSSDITRQVKATLDIRAIDRSGTTVFSRSIAGFGTDENRAKLFGPMNAPESRAARDACERAADELRAYLRTERDLRAAPAVATTPPPVAGLTITVSSDPVQADILINGQFHGTTPQTITLTSDKPITLRLERTGCKAWERTLTPTTGMTIAPVLDKTP